MFVKNYLFNLIYIYNLNYFNVIFELFKNKFVFYILK